MTLHAGLSLAVISVGIFWLAGCSTKPAQPVMTPGATAGISGRVHGGQQPISYATIQLYAVGTTGDGSAATPLLTQSVSTDQNGSFSLSPLGTPLYSCTNATMVYLTATAGYPLPGTPNPNLVLTTALGPCASLTTSTFIWVNEVTTVAAVSALAPYMSSVTAIGSGTGDASQLAAAFTFATQLADTSAGTSPGPNVPAGMTVPSAQIYTLADIVSNCVNSGGGTAGDNTACGQLFSLTTPGSTAPTNTMAALLNLANNPTMNTQQLFDMTSGAAPFQPTLVTTPPSFQTQLLPEYSTGYPLQIAPNSLTFPVTNLGTPSSSQTVILQNNNGSSAITLGAINVIGADAADFSKTTTCGSSLTAGASCLIYVTFTPAAVGSRMAYLSVASSTAISRQYVALSGTGGAPSMGPRGQLSTQALTFFIAGSGSLRDITLSNTGAAPLAISGMTTTTPYFVPTSNCGVSVAAGSSCTVTIQDETPITNTNYYSSGARFIDQLTIATNDTADVLAVILTAEDYLMWQPGNVMFPPTALGSSSTATLDANVLALTIPMSSFTSPPVTTIAGTNATDFTVSSACQTNAPPETCGLTVTFTPQAAGTRTASLLLDSEGDYLPLTGSAVGSVPTTLTFSSSNVLMQDFAGGSVTLTNPSSSPVAISSITTTAGFTQTNNCGSSLFGDSVCTINLTATRTVAGGTQGLLTVSGGFGSVSTVLTSQVDPIVLFGNWSVGQASTLPRTIGAPMQDVVSGSTGGTNASDFTTSSCGSYYNSCTAPLIFEPSRLGARSATLLESFTANSTNYSQNYVLQGTGVAAGPQIMFDLPDGAAGNYTFGVYNSGTTAMVIDPITIGGADAADFSLLTSGTSNCAGLAVGASCKVSLGVTSTSPGFRHATVTLADIDSGQSFTTPVVAWIPYRPPTVSPAGLSFPATALDTTSASISVTVSTSNDDAISVVPESTSSAEFVLTKSSCAMGESPCLINVIFNPTISGSAFGAFEVTDTATGGTVSFVASGTGGIGLASVLPTILNFPTRPAGSTSVAVPVTLSNVGTGSFAVSAVSLTGANATEFSMTNTCSGSVGTSGNCTIDVTFAPLTAGNKSASIVISGDASAGLPLTVPITGRAD